MGEFEISPKLKSLVKPRHHWRYLNEAEIIEAERANSWGDRVSLIVDMRTKSRWMGARTAQELSQFWGISLDEVAAMNKDASSAFRSSVENPEVVRGEQLAKLKYIQQLAIEAKVPFLDKATGRIEYADRPDLASAIKASTEINGLMSLKSTKPPEEQGDYTGDDLQKLINQYNSSKKPKQIQEHLDEHGRINAIGSKPTKRGRKKAPKKLPSELTGDDSERDDGF